MKLISIIYPADPMGEIPGGIDTFIQGILKYAPENVEFEVIGITTNADRYTVGEWHECQTQNGRKFKFLPLLFEAHWLKRKIIPLSLRFTFQLLKKKSLIGGDVLEFHRFEPVLAMLGDQRPKTLFVHQDLQAMKSTNSDIKWRHFSCVFFALEKRCLKQFELIHCVKQAAVDYYKRTLPQQQKTIFFTPTWYEPEVFNVVEQTKRKSIRADIFNFYGLAATASLLIFVGRVDYQKNPLFLVEIMALLKQQGENKHLFLVGDGVLKAQAQKLARKLDVGHKVHFLGALKRSEIANILQACDAFLLASHYEAMPIAALEALACGVPVIATDVGEMRNIITDENGQLVTTNTHADFVNAIVRVTSDFGLKERAKISASVLKFEPQETLLAIYERYSGFVKR